MIKVIDIIREPRNGFRANFGDSLGNFVQLVHSSHNVFVFEGAVEIDVEVDDRLVADRLGWARLNACQVDVVALQDAKCFVQDAWLVI